MITPNKHETFVKQWYNVGPASSTLVQHCTNVIQMFCVCWAGIRIVAQCRKEVKVLGQILLLGIPSKLYNVRPLA